MINLFLILFNILPIYPLDGANILIELLAYKFDMDYIVDIFVYIHRFFCILFIVLFIILKMYIYSFVLIYFMINYKRIYMLKEKAYLDKLILFGYNTTKR